MSDLSERMPRVMAFPGALGTGLIVRMSDPDAITREQPASVPQISRLNSFLQSSPLFNRHPLPDQPSDSLPRPGKPSSRSNDSLSTTSPPGNSPSLSSRPNTSPFLSCRPSEASGDILQTSVPSLHTRIGAFIDEYERTLSRFRADSIVTAIGEAERGGSFAFPEWAAGLFDLYDALCDATDGAIDPCVGEDLIRLGYDARYSFTLTADAADRLGAIHGRPTWRGDVTRTGRHGTTLVTRRAVHLDFGACGKGYLVDLIGNMIDDSVVSLPSGAIGVPPAPLPHADEEKCTRTAGETGAPYPEFLIDAGGDLLIRSSQPVTIGLEDPADTSQAVGTASVTCGSFCASAPSRRHWQTAGHLELHHLLNAIDGRPAHDVAATWVAVGDDGDGRESSRKIFPLGCRLGRNDKQCYPTALADGLATALFVVSPKDLAARFPFECAVLNPDRTASISRHFPGRFFTPQS